MSDSYTATVGTTDYTFDWTAQKITVENLVTAITAADLKQAIGDAQDEVVGIPFAPIADFYNPVTLTPTSKTFLNVVLRDQWRIDSFSSSGTLTVGEGNVVNANNGADIFSANGSVAFINNTSAAGVLVTGASAVAPQDIIDIKDAIFDELLNGTEDFRLSMRRLLGRLGLDKANPLTTNDDNSISFDDVTISAVNGATSTTQTRDDP